MCRASTHGKGRRCKTDNRKTNARRRDRNMIRASENIINEIIGSQGSEWLGDVKGIGLKINSPLVAKSYALAVKYHAGIKRKSGEPYVNHPIRVARRLQEAGYNNEIISVALLHDTVEDSELTLGHLRKLGYNERILAGIDSVTKREGETYPMAIERARRNPLGRLVKLSDNLDNSSEEQLKPFSEEKRAIQRAKYEPARERLIFEIRSQPSEELILALKEYENGYKIWNKKSPQSFFVKLEYGIDIAQA
ncbi:MAG: HD domain-containing protein [Enterococcus sp.]|nr:HD domain-containing protein [Enterococcus sp.]